MLMLRFLALVLAVVAVAVVAALADTLWLAVLSVAVLAEGDLAILVVVPTLGANAEVFHRGDPVEAVEHAEEVARRQVALLKDAGIAVSGHIGPADPSVAVSDGLRTYRAEHVLVARHRGDGARYLEDVAVDDAAGVFGVPLTEIDVATTRPAPRT